MNGAIIICYDIANNKRRRRLARLLLAYGERVLESVFVCRIPPSDLARLQAAVSDIVSPPDKISYWQICGHDWSGRIWQGRQTQDHDAAYFIY